MIQTEVEAYNQMTREQQRKYIKKLVEDTKTHKINMIQDAKEGFSESAEIHATNIKANFRSLESLLSPVMFCDICEEL